MNFVQAVDNEQILKIVELSKIIWNEHYVEIIGKEQVEYMLDKFLTCDIIKKHIKNEEYKYFLFEKDKEYIGFLAYYVNVDGLFLSKLYLLKEYRGKGLSKLAITFLKNICIEKALNRIWLQVNKENKNSINAYYKLGFNKFKEDITDIGNGFFMDDYYLELII